MSMVTVKYNQNLIDLAIQEAGEATRVFELALLLNRSITEDLTPGETIDMGTVQAIESAAIKVSKLLRKPINIPASGDAASPNVQYEGLEIWAIEADFIIS